ncbi:MAG: TraM recognition domain-containing protein [Candidatus Dojkabacteria bacterium]
MLDNNTQNTFLILITGFALAILVFVVLVFVFRRLLQDFKEAVLMRKSLNLVFYEIRLPKTNDVEIKAAEQMFLGLLGFSESLTGIKAFIGARTFVSFEVVAFKESIRFYVVCPKKIASVIDRQINGAYPTAEITRVKEYNLFPDHAKVTYAAIGLDKDTKIPIQTYEELPVDTMAIITDIFSKLGDGEAAALQLVISPAGGEWIKNSKDYVKKIRDDAKPKEAAEGKPAVTPKQKVPDETLQLIEKKADKNGFHADIRVVVVSPDKFSGESHLTNIMSSFDQYGKIGGNKFKKLKGDVVKTISSDFIYRIPRGSMILNTAELATVFHYPNKNVQAPHIKWLLSKKAPAPDFATSHFDTDFMYVGKNSFRGQEKEIFLKPDARLRHFYIIGQTGSGKSGFMGGMMIRDIKMGHGCAFIDPHGSDAEKILAQVPPERVEDVVIFDPSDLERPVGLNMLEFRNPEQRTLVTNEMLNIFDTLYNLKVTGGPMFEQYFRYGIMLLTDDVESGSTLLEIPKIFADDGYRNYKLGKCKDQEVIDFWRKQAEAAGGEASLKNVVPYVVSKLAPFLTNAYLRPIVAQQNSTIDFRDIMDKKKILIAKLSKGRIGDMNANLLGMILIGKILVAALERDEIPEKDRIPFYLYIDEFQNFLTDGIQIILSEARKYKLGLTIAHQFLGQLTRTGGDNKIRDAVFGNVGNKAIFRIGEEDAPFLRKVLDGNFEENDLQQIENGTAFTKIQVDGKPTPTFTVRSWYGESPYDMIDPSPDPNLPDIIRQISRLKYGKDKNLIENEIKLRGTFIKEKTEEKKPGGMFGGGFPGF